MIQRFLESALMLSLILGTGATIQDAGRAEMAGRPKDIWLALVGRTGLTMLREGMRIQVRLSLPKFPGRDVHMNLTVAEARKWADALNHYADKVENEYR